MDTGKQANDVLEQPEPLMINCDCAEPGVV